MMNRPNTDTLTATQPWLAGVKPSPNATIRLFCFPYSGASASLFYSWRDAIPGVEVCPVELPGHGVRLAEPLASDITSLVPQVAQGIAPALGKPFAFFGHSMGALLSYELARHLCSAYGLHPVHLFVSAHAAPHLSSHEDAIHDLPESEFIAKLDKMNGTPPGVLDNAELRELLLPILRADFAICETYVHRPGDPLSCPLTAMGGLGDAHVTRASLEAWQQHSSGRFTVRMFPGDHFYLNTARQLLLRVVAQELVNFGSVS